MLWAIGYSVVVAIQPLTYRGNKMANTKQVTKQVTKQAKPATQISAQVSAMATMANTLTTLPVAVPPVRPVPLSHLVMANLTAGKLVPPTNLGKWQGQAGALVQLTPAGVVSSQLAARLNANAKNGPCPFLAALYNGAVAGQTLAQAWQACASIAGHGQQGKGQGGYTAAQALTYYLKGKWFRLTA